MKAILQHDEIKDLLPLKFYVIRQTRRRIEAQEDSNYGNESLGDYGKEAAEAVLDVAGEYDFTRGDSSEPIQNLKSAITQALHGNDGISADDWIPPLLGRLEKEPRRWRGLTSSVLAFTESEKPDVQSLLLTAAKGPSYSAEVRGAALQALVRSDPDLNKESTAALLRAALISNETALVQGALNALALNHLDQFPEQMQLFFHPEDSIRWSAIQSFLRIRNSKFRLQVVESLLAVLDDSTRATDHLSVIETLRISAPHRNHEFGNRELLDRGAPHSLYCRA